VIVTITLVVALLLSEECSMKHPSEWELPPKKKRKNVKLSDAQKAAVAIRMIELGLSEPSVSQDAFQQAIKEKLPADKQPSYNHGVWRKHMAKEMMDIYVRSKQCLELQQQVKDLQARIDQLRAEKAKTELNPIEVLQTAMPAEILHNCWDSLLKLPLQHKLALLPMDVVIERIPTSQLIQVLAARLMTLVDTPAPTTNHVAAAPAPVVTVKTAPPPKLPQVYVLGLQKEQLATVATALKGLAKVTGPDKDLGSKFTVPIHTDIVVSSRFVAHPMTQKLDVKLVVEKKPEGRAASLTGGITGTIRCIKEALIDLEADKKKALLK